MKLTISPCEEYPRHELHIQDWLAEKKGIYNQFKSKINILKITKEIDENGVDRGAYNIAIEKTGESHWIPKSQCKIIERSEELLSKFI